MKTVAIWGISPKTRLKLKLLAVAHGRTMAEEVSGLIEKGFQRDDISLTDKMMSRIRRVIGGHHQSWIKIALSIIIDKAPNAAVYSVA